MSDAAYDKTAGNVSHVQDKLKLFPEVHMYKAENGTVRKSTPKQQPAGRKTESAKGEGRRLERIFIVVIVFLVVVAAGELLFHFVISPKLMINKVLVRSGPNVQLTDAEVLRLAELTDDIFYFSLSTEEVAKRLESYPLIKKAAVEKKFPDSLSIDLQGRAPLAVSIVDTEDGAVPIVFDEEGVVFQIGTSVKEMDNLVFSGIVFKNLQLGMKLPEEMSGLLESLYRLKTESPELFRLLSEVKIVKRSSSQYETVLYFSGYRMPVRAGMSIDAKELKYILMVLDVVTIEDLKKRIQELDVRSGEVVYKMKEVESGE